MKILVSLLLIILIRNTLISQTSNSVINVINQANQIEYQVKEWNIIESQADTIFKIGIHKVFLTEKDSLFNGFFNFDYPDNATIYNGNEYIMVNKNTKIATVVNLIESPEWKIKNIYCTNSFIEIFKILNRAKTDKAFELKENREEINIHANDIAYYGRMVNMLGVNTEFSIKLFPKSYYPQSINIKSFKNGKFFREQNAVFSDLKISANADLKYYTKESIDSSITIVAHKYIKNIKVGDTMPNWVVYPPFNYKKILLRELNKSDFLLIEFWFTNCQYCIKSIPLFNELHHKFKNSGLKIIYANNENEPDKAIEDFRIKYQIAFDVYRFGNIFEQGNSPTILLVDKNGIIRYKKDGYTADLVADIDNLMNEMKK